MKSPIVKEKVQKAIKPMCKNCKKILDHRIPRPKLIKTLAPWLKFKRYKCVNCLRICYRLR